MLLLGLCAHRIGFVYVQQSTMLNLDTPQINLDNTSHSAIISPFGSTVSSLNPLSSLRSPLSGLNATQAFHLSSITEHLKPSSTQSSVGKSSGGSGGGSFTINAPGSTTPSSSNSSSIIGELQNTDTMDQTRASLRQALMDPILGARRRLVGCRQSPWIQSSNKIGNSSSNYWTKQNNAEQDNFGLNNNGMVNNNNNLASSISTSSTSSISSSSSSSTEPGGSKSIKETTKSFGRHLRPLAESFVQYLDSHLSGQTDSGSSNEPSPACSPMPSPRNSPYLTRRVFQTAQPAHSGFTDTPTTPTTTTTCKTIPTKIKFETTETPPTPPTTPTGFNAEIDTWTLRSASSSVTETGDTIAELRKKKQTQKQTIQSQSKPKFKFDVANFDLNAVGPSSW